jgi:hypothetical protein
MWLQALLFLLVALIGVLLYGAWRWRAGTYSLRARLDAARAPQAPGVFHSKELEGLPACVQNYFRAVLPEAHPLIASARLRHTGTFNLGNGVERWRPFESTQYVVASRPGFDWDARIAMAPGIKAFVHDAYAAGEGILRVEALGLIPIVQLRVAAVSGRGCVVSDALAAALRRGVGGDRRNVGKSDIAGPRPFGDADVPVRRRRTDCERICRCAVPDRQRGDWAGAMGGPVLEL